MFKNISFKKKLLGYLMLVILLLVMMSGTSNFFMARSALLKNTKDGLQNVVNQLMNSNDLLADNMEKSMKALVEGRDMELFPSRFSYLNYEERELVYNKLLQILNMSLYYTSCYVYYPQSGQAIDVNTYKPQFTSVETHQERTFLLKAYDTYQEQSSSQSSGIYAVQTSESEIEWVLMLPVSPYQADLGLLLLTISPDYFYNAVSTRQSDIEMKIYIAGQNGDWLSQPPSEEVLQNAAYQNLYEQKSGEAVLKIEGDDCLVFHTTAPQTKWNYISAIRLRDVYGQIDTLALGTLLSIAGCIAAGVLMAFYFARRASKPIREIAGIFADDQRQDEIKTITDGILRLQNANKTLMEQVEENSLALRNVFLLDFLSGELSKGKSLDKEFETYQISLPRTGAFFVLLLSISGLEGQPLYSHQQLLLFELFFEEDMKRNFGEEQMGFESVKINPTTFAFILSMESGDCDEGAIIAKIEASRKLAEKVANKATISIGCSCQGNVLYDVPLLFKQAKSALEYRHIIGYGNLTCYREIVGKQRAHFEYPYALEKEILGSVRQGDHESARRQIQQFHNDVTRNVVDLAYCRYSFILLFSCILKDLGEFDSVCLNGVSQDETFRRILSGKTTQEITDIIKRFTSTACEFINQTRVNRLYEISDEIKSYIDENFACPELSLDMIAEYFHYSVSYISKVFKSCFDRSIKDYITDRRIEKACHLLRNSGDKIKEIAEKVGYAQQRSFIEIFKKNLGVTPSAYRAQKEKGEE